VKRRAGGFEHRFGRVLQGHARDAPDRLTRPGVHRSRENPLGLFRSPEQIGEGFRRLSSLLRIFGAAYGIAKEGAQLIEQSAHMFILI
jgi:hypothetical protein